MTDSRRDKGIRTEQRTILPMSPAAAPGPTSTDMRKQPGVADDSHSLAPPDAPNIVVILLDDMGFGASSAFGGPCEMATADRLASAGLRFTRFHTAAMCSPTRAALLTGRNHHSVGMGSVTNFAVNRPGYDAMIPQTAATIGRVLTCNGYATGAFGKMHETPPREVTPVGPFDRWPTGRLGFEKFYGFIGSHTNEWCPGLWDGTTAIDPPTDGSYHFSEALVDHAVSWIRDVRSIAPGKPFFCYLPFAATHAPFHVAHEWVEKYKGRFDHGWDRQREITLERQKSLGVVPPETELAPWPAGVPHWDELSDAERGAASALMEVYAGFAEHTDVQVGRFVDSLAEMGVLDNTLIFYILGDNGASAEGGLGGTHDQYLVWNKVDVTAADIINQADRLGGPDTWPHYPAGWALAMDTPYQWVKQMASHYGGTRNGLIVHWPSGIDERGGIRHQWHHVIDLYPTIMDVAALPIPQLVDGASQMPLEGTGMSYCFNATHEPDRHTTQYFEIGGSRGIYHDGWVACAPHRTAPWALHQESPDFKDDVWELYDTVHDWSQAKDLALQFPDRLEHLKELFLIEAVRHNALPLDDRPLSRRRNSKERDGRSSMTFHGMSRRINSDAMPNLVGKSFVLTADVEIAEAGAEGVLCAQGGRFAGWSLYFANGRMTYCHKLGVGHAYYVRADAPIASGHHVVELRFRYDGNSLGAGGECTLIVDGQAVGRQRIDRTVSFLFQISEEFNVGCDPRSPVSDEYHAVGNAFSGSINWLRIDVGEGPGLSVEDRVKAHVATQ